MMEGSGEWWKEVENDGRKWRMMEGSGEWWKEVENDEGRGE